jgi:ketosteroid isomerase-like protein
MKTLSTLFAIVASACALPAADREVAKAELLKVEADFCALCVKSGAPAAFNAYIAPDGILLGIGPDVRGEQIVKDRYMDYAIGSTLTWKPLVVDVAESGELGYTTGTSELRTPGKDGAPDTVSHGRYFTVWKRQPDSSWKFVLDGGSADHARKKQTPTSPVKASP